MVILLAASDRTYGETKFVDLLARWIGARLSHLGGEELLPPHRRRPARAVGEPTALILGRRPLIHCRRRSIIFAPKPVAPPRGEWIITGPTPPDAHGPGDP